jgi:hypothetical protein
MMDTTELKDCSHVEITGTVFYLSPPTITAQLGEPIQKGILADEKGQVKFVINHEQVGTLKKGDKIYLTGWYLVVENEPYIQADMYKPIKIIK